MKKIFGLLILFSLQLSAQDCRQKLEEAQLAYFNGRFQACLDLLRPCLDNLPNRDDQILAWELIAKSNIMLQDDRAAESAMAGILNVNPFYQARADISVSLIELYDRFKLIRQWQFGLNTAYLSPRYEVLKFWSYSAIVDDGSPYQAEPSFQLQGWMNYHLYQGLQINLGLAFQNIEFYRSELQQEYLLQSSQERYQFYSPSVGLEYLIPWHNWTFVANGGYQWQILQKARADIALDPQAGEFPAAFPGYSELAGDQDLLFQRTSILPNVYYGLGLRYGKGAHQIEIAYRFHQGWKNMIVEDQRYTKSAFLNPLSYVPDDYTMSFGSWQLGYVYTILKAYRK